MPLPPGEEEEKNTEETSEPKLQFSYVECLIFAFHQLAKKVDMNCTFHTVRWACILYAGLDLVSGQLAKVHWTVSFG